MTDLQRMALERIRNLADSIELQMTAYALVRSETHEEAMKRDKESSDKWSKSKSFQREIVEWTAALLEEPKL